MDQTDKTTLTLALLWIWGFTMASVLRWWSHRFNNWLKPKGQGKRKRQEKRQAP